MVEETLVNKFIKIALFVDSFGYKQLIDLIKHKNIGCIVVASNRNYYKSIYNILPKKIPILVQPSKQDYQRYKVFLWKLKSLKIDFIISNSYSMLITEEILKLVRFKAINIHWSLLPKNRGSNPIQWAIIKDEDYTGITIHKMDKNIDTGKIVFQKNIKIEESYTWTKLNKILIKKSKTYIKKCLSKILLGNIKSKKQCIDDATVNKRLTKDFPLIDFNMDDKTIYNLIRAQVKPLSGAYIIKDNKRIYFNTFIKLEDISKLREKYE